MFKGKVAIVHDWLNGMRGGEKVLEEILQLFPQGDIYTLFYQKNNISQRINSQHIVCSSLNKYRWVRNHYRSFLPFFPAAIEEFNLQDYDLVISSSHCVAKGIIPHPQAIHFSYVHSPMRYIWDQYYTYFGRTRGFKRALIKWQSSKLRIWDVSSSNRVNHFIANSSFVKSRIWQYYRRQAEVIHPPVDTDFFSPAAKPERNYFLSVSALVPYKEVHLLVKAFNRSGDRLIVVGKGSEEKSLKKMAKKNVEFKKNISAEELQFLYQNAIALVFAGIEDFGISFVESLASGTPVVALQRGGVLDIVKEGMGVLFKSQKIDHIIAACTKVRDLEINETRLRERSLLFSKNHFREKLRKTIQEKL